MKIIIDVFWCVFVRLGCSSQLQIIFDDEESAKKYTDAENKDCYEKPYYYKRIEISKEIE